MTNKKKMTDKNKVFLQAIGRILRTPDVETNQDNSVDTEQSNGENGEKFSSMDEYIDSLKQENAALKDLIKVRQEVFSLALQWYRGIGGRVFDSKLGKAIVDAKLGQFLGSEGAFWIKLVEPNMYPFPGRPLIFNDENDSTKEMTLVPEKKYSCSVYGHYVTIHEGDEDLCLRYRDWRYFEVVRE